MTYELLLRRLVASSFLWEPPVLQFVVDKPSDIAHFDCCLRSELTLNRQVEGIDHVRPKLRIDRGRIRCGRVAAYTRQEWLWQN